MFRCVFCVDWSEVGYEISSCRALRRSSTSTMRKRSWSSDFRRTASAFEFMTDPVNDRPAVSMQGQLAGYVPAVADDSAFSQWAVETNLMRAAAARRRVGEGCRQHPSGEGDAPTRGAVSCCRARHS